MSKLHLNRKLVIVGISIFVMLLASYLAVFEVYRLNTQSQDFSKVIQRDITTVSNRLALEQALNTEIETYIQLGDNYQNIMDMTRASQLNTHLEYTDTFITNELSKIQILIDNIRLTQSLSLALAKTPEAFSSIKGFSSIEFASQTISRAEYKILFRRLSTAMLDLIQYQNIHSQNELAEMLSAQNTYIFISLGTFIYIILALFYAFNFHLKQTREILHLQQEQTITELNNKDKEYFLSNISHEIRTPLNGLFGIIQSIEANYSQPNKVKSYIASALQSYDHITSLVNGLLDLSKEKVAKEPIRPRPFYLADVINLVINEQESIAEQKGLTLEHTIPEWEATTRRSLDPIKLSQIIRNLLNNAIKFTKKGTVTLHVNSTEVNDSVKISISDTGIGIPQDKQALIFDAFQQVDNELDKQYQGTGLGLHIVQTLVERMGGLIEVRSEPKKGTTFEVFIPLATLNEDTKQEKKNKPQHPVVLPKALTVLLVEDNEINQMVFCSLLENKNIKVIVAEDGYACLEIIENHRFDLIFMDIQMPGMDGIMTFESLQKMEINTPVVALTGNVMPKQVAEYFAVGFTDVLAKPYKKEQLLKMLSQHTKVISQIARH